MNKPLTVNELLKECQRLVSEGAGEKVIMLSDDDEGNGYHYMWYSFSNPVEMVNKAAEANFDNYVIEGLNEAIAPIDQTIILG